MPLTQSEIEAEARAVFGDAAVDEAKINLPGEKTLFDAALDRLRVLVGKKTTTAPLPTGRLINGVDLMKWEPGKMDWIIEDTMSRGLNLLVGQMKVGKSFLLLQIAEAVSTGRPLLGMNVKKGKVLYYPIEDGAKRLVRRMQAMKLDADFSNIEFRFEGSANPAELALQIAADVERLNGDVTLVIIDTFKMASGGRGDSRLNAYEADVEMIAPFKRLTEAGDLAILGTFHERKPKTGAAGESDHYNSISGSAGLAATADTFLRLIRERESRSGRLYIGGRDVEDERLIEMEQPLGCDGRWMEVSPAKAAAARAMVGMKNGCRKDILRTVLGRGTIARGDLRAHMPEHTAQNIRQSVGRLVSDNLLNEDADGVLSLPTPPDDGFSTLPGDGA